MKKVNKLSTCIPPDLVEEIIRNGREQDDQHVYGVAKRGKIDNVEFMGSYEEILYEKRTFKEDLSLIGSYSTSCSLTLKGPRKFLRFLKAGLFKTYTHPIIIHGNTICGLSQLTKERIPDYPDKEHVDWWIYQDSFDKLIKEFKVFEDFNQEGLTNE